jgi:secreted trypsin-like serine protease
MAKVFGVFVLCVNLAFSGALSAGAATVSDKNEGSKDVSPSEPARNLIIGGRDALPGEFPFFAAGVIDCGGTLIHEDIVLTAAHCIVGGNAFADGVQIGGYIRPSALLDDPTLVDETEERIDFACVLVHPDYFVDGFADIALVKLANPSQTGQVIKVNFDPSVPAVNDVVSALGYGISGYVVPGEISDYILPTFLQVLYPSKIQSEDSCTAGDIESPGRYNPDYLLCILDDDLVTTDCNGDSGGPIFTGDGKIGCNWESYRMVLISL